MALQGHQEYKWAGTATEVHGKATLRAAIRPDELCRVRGDDSGTVTSRRI